MSDAGNYLNSSQATYALTSVGIPTIAVTSEDGGESGAQQPVLATATTPLHTTPFQHTQEQLFYHPIIPNSNRNTTTTQSCMACTSIGTEYREMLRPFGLHIHLSRASNPPKDQVERQTEVSEDLWDDVYSSVQKMQDLMVECIMHKTNNMRKKWNRASSTLFQKENDDSEEEDSGFDIEHKSNFSSRYQPNSVFDREYLALEAVIRVLGELKENLTKIRSSVCHVFRFASAQADQQNNTTTEKARTTKQAAPTPSHIPESGLIQDFHFEFRGLFLTIQFYIEEQLKKVDRWWYKHRAIVPQHKRIKKLESRLSKLQDLLVLTEMAVLIATEKQAVIDQCVQSHIPITKCTLHFPYCDSLGQHKSLMQDYAHRLDASNFFGEIGSQFAPQMKRFLNLYVSVTASHSSVYHVQNESIRTGLFIMSNMYYMLKPKEAAKRASQFLASDLSVESGRGLWTMLDTNQFVRKAAFLSLSDVDLSATFPIPFVRPFVPGAAVALGSSSSSSSSSSYDGNGCLSTATTTTTTTTTTPTLYRDAQQQSSHEQQLLFQLSDIRLKDQLQAEALHRTEEALTEGGCIKMQQITGSSTMQELLFYVDQARKMLSTVDNIPDRVQLRIIVGHCEEHTTRSSSKSPGGVMSNRLSPLTPITPMTPSSVLSSDNNPSYHIWQQPANNYSGSQPVDSNHYSNHHHQHHVPRHCGGTSTSSSSSSSVHSLLKRDYPYLGNIKRAMRKTKSRILRLKHGVPSPFSDHSNQQHGITNNDGLIFHVHGGGFIAMSSFSHEIYLRPWSTQTALPVISVDYTHSPEQQYPVQIEQCYQSYLWVLEHAETELCVSLNKIIFAGDSAGGNIILGVLTLAILNGVRLPDALVLSYPVTYLNFSPSPARLISMLDPLLNVKLLELCGMEYYFNTKTVNVETNAQRNPLVSPCVLPAEILQRFPPTYINCGACDPLFDDSIYLAKRLENEIGRENVKLEVYDGLGHGYLNLVDFVPEAKTANNRICDWIKQQMMD